MMNGGDIIGNPSNSGGMIFQHNQVPLDAGRQRQLKYPKMKVIPIRIFSAACIILGITSIGIQIASLVINATELYDYIIFEEADYVAAGIWGGTFYIIAGSLGIAATHLRTQSLLVGTVVMSALSVFASIVAATLAGLAAEAGFYCYIGPYNLCNAWYGLEWSLMGFSILEFCMAIPLLVFTSVAVCCSSKRKNDMMAFGYPTQGYVFAGSGQPIHYQTQQMVQLQPSSFPVSYVGQQIRQQQPTNSQEIATKQEQQQSYLPAV